MRCRSRSSATASGEPRYYRQADAEGGNETVTGWATWLAVGVGGALGSVARHAANRLIHEHWLTTRFPLSTLFVNVTGCFVIGVLAGAIAAGRIAMSAYWREFVFVGILGGFTTFSTFGLDTLLLVRSHSAGYAALNVGGQVAGGLLAVWLGYQLGLAKT